MARNKWRDPAMIRNIPIQLFSRSGLNCDSFTEGSLSFLEYRGDF